MQPKQRRVVIACLVGAALLAAAIFLLQASPQAAQGDAQSDADLRQEFAAIPKIDVHTHLPSSMARSLLSLVEREGVVMMLNASGGHPGPSLLAAMRAADATGGRVLPYCLPDFRGSWDPEWAEYARALVAECRARGAVGIKIAKGLGLGYEDQFGELLRVDAPELDALFEAAADHQMPILIHTADPLAFFEPNTPANERYAELQAHPAWSFSGARPGGGAWPSWRALIDALEARVARHPRTKFLGAHFGNAPEDLDWVEHMLERYPNFYIETAARIPEIGRHDPARVRGLFERFPERILFGTDFQAMPGDAYVLGSAGAHPHTREDIHPFFVATWRFFETQERQIDHPSPIQGDWKIDAIGLPEPLLRRVYYQNAEALFGIQLPEAGSAAPP